MSCVTPVPAIFSSSSRARHARMPFAGPRADHRAGIELPTIDARAAEAAPDLEVDSLRCYARGAGRTARMPFRNRRQFDPEDSVARNTGRARSCRNRASTPSPMIPNTRGDMPARG